MKEEKKKEMLELVLELVLKQTQLKQQELKLREHICQLEHTIKLHSHDYCEEQVHKLTEENNKLRAENDELRGNLINSGEVIKQLTRAKARLEDDLSMSVSEICDLKDKFQIQEQMPDPNVVAKLKLANSNLEADVEALYSKCTEMARSMQERKTNFMSTNSRLTTTLNELKQQVTTLEDKVVELDASLLRSRTEKNQLHDKLTLALVTERNTANENWSALTVRISSNCLCPV